MTYSKEHYNKISTTGNIISGIYPAMLDKLKNGDDIQELEQYLDYIIWTTNDLKRELLGKIED